MTEVTEGTVAADNSADYGIGNHHAVQTVDNSVHDQQEKTLSQSEVNRLIAATKHETARKVHSQYENSQSSKISAEDVAEMVRKELKAFESKAYDENLRAQQIMQEQQLVHELKPKIEAASKKYDDFQEVTSSIDFESAKSLLYGANSVENSGDVLYELSKNPSKAKQIQSMLDDPKWVNAGLAELKKLSKSIQNNASAKENHSPRSPLSDIRPSSVGADKGEMSDVDFLY